MPTKKITKVESFSLDKPAQLAQLAVNLKSHIEKQQLFTIIQGKKYVHVDGWQYGGSLLGLHAVIREVQKVSLDPAIHKYLAVAEIRQLATGNVVSVGMALCSKEEPKKRTFDEYSVMSMAQTRAIGKAYRNLIGWIMKMANYEATPAEEMDEFSKSKKETPKEKAKPPVEGKLIDCAGACGAVVDEKTAEYSKKLFMRPLCRDCQKNEKAFVTPATK